MPKIQPTSPEKRRAFRKTPSPRQRPQFDEPAGLISRPRQDLDWHHAVGRLTAELRPDAGQGSYHGTAWFVGLPEALGPRRWFFHKAVLLAELYPTKTALEELKDLGVDWTRVSLSFPIPRREQRHAFLGEAARATWTIPQFQYALQERFRTPRRVVGGRRRHTPGHWGPEVSLRQLGRLTQGVLDFHTVTWGGGIGARGWRAFVKECRGPEGDALRRLLDSTAEAVAVLAASAGAMGDRLTRLRGRS